MSGFTIHNLGETEDSAPKFGYGEHQEARFASGDLESEQSGLSMHRVKPDQRQGFGHRHETTEELYVVISGSGRIKLDDEIREVGPLDAIRVSPQITRAFEAGPDGLEVLAFGARGSDGELDHEFWPED